MLLENYFHSEAILNNFNSSERRNWSFKHPFFARQRHFRSKQTFGSISILDRKKIPDRHAAQTTFCQPPYHSHFLRLYKALCVFGLRRVRVRVQARERERERAAWDARESAEGWVSFQSMALTWLESGHLSIGIPHMCPARYARRSSSWSWRGGCERGRGEREREESRKIKLRQCKQ